MSWTSSVDRAKGTFQRKESVFRHWISSAPGSRFPPAASRYHLYVSLACPWAHRTLIVKRLKGLDGVIGHTVVDHFLDKTVGWRFNPTVPRCEADPIHGFQRLRQVYELAEPSYSGNITVPVLFDRVHDTIVNNESSDIIRMINSEFNEWCASPEQAAVDLYPAALRPAIDEVNSWVYPNINNGVYRSGFATSQTAYEEAVTALFAHLDRADDLLARQRYLAGPQLTEADVRLFTSLLRFDIVYYGHFKCNRQRLQDYAALWPFLLDLCSEPLIRDTISVSHIKQHYYASHDHINPTRIVPIGPAGYDEYGPTDLSAAHKRRSHFQTAERAAA